MAIVRCISVEVTILDKQLILKIYRPVLSCFQEPIIGPHLQPLESSRNSARYLLKINCNITFPFNLRIFQFNQNKQLLMYNDPISENYKKLHKYKLIIEAKRGVRAR
jgi:hypothetical protein